MTPASDVFPKHVCLSVIRLLAIMAIPQLALADETAGPLKAGAAKVDITPTSYPVLVNGGMTSRSVDKAITPLYARAVVVDDGVQRIAMVVVDSCMIGREVLDDAKHLAATRTKIQPDHILISATHTHTAPSSMACLGTEVQDDYLPLLREKLAEVIATAESNLEPAKAGWGIINAAEYTALRRWIIRPDKMGTDPFGNPTVRANMHAGANWDNVTGESGPEDPDLSMISFQAFDGRPIALIANFSMHYFSGVPPLHYDYFGIFCEGMEQKISPDIKGHADNHPEFVAILSHGCSGDIWRRDYTNPNNSKWVSPTIEDYTSGLIALANTAYGSIKYSAAGPVRMAEARIPMKYRVPDKQRLEWAHKVVNELGDAPPKTTEQVYAREQIILHERQSTEVVVQAIQIGEIAIASTPNETYALTGLKMKLQSPVPNTMVIELANGGDGYIPPPEQHLLGGYNTWAARSAGLEVAAEPRITATALQLLEQVTQKPRRTYAATDGVAATAIQKQRPIAWWRLEEFSGPHAMDHSGHGRHAVLEPAIAYFLQGPHSDSFCTNNNINRCIHLVGNRLRSQLSLPRETYSVSMWFWNGMPADARATSGWLFSRDYDHGLTQHGDHVGIGGSATFPGTVVFQHGSQAGSAIHGRTQIPRWTWHHLVFVRDGREVRIYLDGNPDTEIRTETDSALSPDITQFFFGGRSDNDSNWEGRIDEVAMFDRALSAQEAVALFVSSPEPKATMAR